ncbi:MAG: hypothetical protein K2Y71_24725 [Xanthobacteraceae bacterium]|nr:hypothetical protein [Xanthobacteraceae bacterium]
MRIIRPIITVIAISLVGAFSFSRLAAEEAAPKPKPYKPVAVELPQPVKDPSFAAFRQQIADIAKRKDRAALAKIVAANFFWQTDDGKDVALKGRPGIDTLVRALYLDNPETEGWDILQALAADATGDPAPERKGVICAPGEPKLDSAEAAALGEATGTTSSFWYYPSKAGLEVRDGAAPGAKVTGKLGMHLVWVYPDESPAAAVFNDSVRIVLPSGAFGWVAAEALMPLPGDLLCYVKDGNSWRIAGFLGGMPAGK